MVIFHFFCDVDEFNPSLLLDGSSTGTSPVRVLTGGSDGACQVGQMVMGPLHGVIGRRLARSLVYSGG